MCRRIADKGEQGVSGPSSMTRFEIHGEWNEKHVVLQNMCFPIAAYLKENPDVADVVIITADKFESKFTEEKD